MISVSICITGEVMVVVVVSSKAVVIIRKVIGVKETMAARS